MLLAPQMLYHVCKFEFCFEWLRLKKKKIKQLWVWRFGLGNEVGVCVLVQSLSGGNMQKGYSGLGQMIGRYQSRKQWDPGILLIFHCITSGDHMFPSYLEIQNQRLYLYLMNMSSVLVKIHILHDNVHKRKKQLLYLETSYCSASSFFFFSSTSS